MTINNKERLEQLRQRVIDGFAGAAKDVHTVLESDIDSFQNRQGSVAVIQTGEAFLPGMGKTLRFEAMNTPHEYAKKIVDLHRDAYTRCQSQDFLRGSETAQIADHLMADWRKSQMLLVCPDLAEYDDADVQADVTDFLNAVEEHLTMHSAHRVPSDEGKPDVFSAFLYSLEAHDTLVDVERERAMVGLESAEKLLRAVHTISRSL